MSQRAIVAALLVATVASTIQLPSSTAGAAQAEQGSPPSDPAVDLVDQSTWVARDEVFYMRVEADHVPPGAGISLDVHPRLTARHDFAATLDDGVRSQALTTPFSLQVAEMEADAEGALPLSFTPADVGLTEGGVYPLELRITDEAGQQVAGFVTFLLLLPPAFPNFTPLTVATIFEVDASAGLQPDGTAHISRDELEQIRVRAEALEQIDVPVSVAPVPETLEALVALGEDDLVAALGGSELLARPYVDIDLEAWAAAGLVTEVPREAEAGAQVVRSLYGVEPQPGIWLPDRTVSAAEAAAWGSLGVRHVVFPPDAIAGTADAPWGGISSPVQASAGPAGFVSDEALVNRLLNVERPLDVHHFVSELAMIWFEYPSRPRAVALRVPGQAPFDAGLVANAFARMGNDQAVSPVTATELFRLYDSESAVQEQAAPVELGPKPPPEDLGWMIGPLEESKRTLAGLAEVIESGPLLTSLERSLLIAPGSRTPEADRARYLERVEAAATEVAEKINAPETFRITLTAREGTIPLTISNDLGHEVSVRVHLASSQLEFPDGAELDLVVPPEGARTDLRVKPRTSGAFPLHIRITSPDGNLVVDETTFNVRSTVISGVGLVLSAGAALFLAVWWTRHWRQARRRPTS